MHNDTKNLDTLTIYKHALEAGFNEGEALSQAYTAKNIEETLWKSLKEYIKELKAEFASQRALGSLGTLILAVAAGIVGVLWVLTTEMSAVKKDIELVKTEIHEIKNFVIRKEQ